MEKWNKEDIQKRAKKALEDRMDEMAPKDDVKKDAHDEINDILLKSRTEDSNDLHLAFETHIDEIVSRGLSTYDEFNNMSLLEKVKLLYKYQCIEDEEYFRLVESIAYMYPDSETPDTH